MFKNCYDVDLYSNVWKSLENQVIPLISIAWHIQFQTQPEDNLGSQNGGIILAQVKAIFIWFPSGQGLEGEEFIWELIPKY